MKTEYRSVAEIITHSKNIGHHFFSKDAMKFFGSKVYEDLHLGKYFITSEKDNYRPDHKREYTIRKCVDGDVSTVGVHGQYASLRAARNALAKIKED
jgi:hypothetical protein